jgi:class 3 adenylate cyclase
VVLVSDWFSHQGDLWRADSPFRPVLDRLARFSHLVTFDKRGIGLSDPVQLSTLPTLEEWVDDLRSVLDSLGIDQAVIIGKGSGGPMAALFAATHPKRVSGLVFVNAWARLGAAPDFPIGVPEEMQVQMLDTPYMPSASVHLLAGEPVTDALEAWWQAYVRSAASPVTSSTMRRWLFSVDVRSALPLVQCPSLVICRRDAWIGADHARFLADHLTASKLVELPGSADFLFAGDTDALLVEIEEFVTGERPEPTDDRVMATVLYTDLVESTALASRIGDRQWSQVLDRHDRLVREAIDVGSGEAIKHTGDGFLATFAGPARAIRCAEAVRDGLRVLGLEMRAGLHAGEIERRDDDIAGIATHIGARIEALADPGEILVSRTVHDLVAGSGIEFRDRGVHRLKGIPEPQQLYAVAD